MKGERTRPSSSCTCTSDGVGAGTPGGGFWRARGPTAQNEGGPHSADTVLSGLRVRASAVLFTRSLLLSKSLKYLSASSLKNSGQGPLNIQLF